MSRAAALLFLISALLFVPQSRADVAAIRTDALPQEAAILNALDDARQLEPYSRSYTRDWAFPVPREDALSRLGKDLGFLKIALQAHPDNPELLLLTGLVAHYAYNLDLDGSYDAAMQSLAGAEKRAPSDLRPAWFRASLLCQTSHPKAGADEFLAIEASRPWDRLPAAFWDDYMECATVTAMTAHVLRAADHLEKLHARKSAMRTILTDAALKRFDPYDPAKTYDSKDVWEARDAGSFVEFTSTTCGVRFRSPSAWTVHDLSLKSGACQGIKSQLHPSILLLVKRAGEDQALEDFAGRYTANGAFQPFTASRCPADRCLALQGVQPRMYGKEGDGHGRVIVFERDQPDFPGLSFETPWELPDAGANDAPNAYRPSQVKARIPGKLFYLVVLDAAASIEEPALKDLDAFLKDLIVD
jgi:hypothetical protein